MGRMDLNERRYDPKYEGFWKVNLGILSVKKAISPVIDETMRKFHQEIIESENAMCGKCDVKNPRLQSFQKDGEVVKRWEFNPPPCDLCLPWLRRVEAKMKNMSEKMTDWRNTDMKQWQTEPWEIAKIYMASGKKKENKSSAETDCTNLLQLVDQCTLFQFEPAKTIPKLKEIRNQVFHSPDLEIDREYALDALKLMRDFLLQCKQLEGRKEAKNAADEIKQYRLHLKDGGENVSESKRECISREDAESVMAEFILPKLEDLKHDFLECKESTKDSLKMTQKIAEEVAELRGMIEDNPGLKKKMDALNAQWRDLIEQELEDLNQRVANLEVQRNNCSTSSSVSGAISGQIGGDLKTSYAFECVIRSIGKNWIQLARALKFSNSDIEEIEEKYPRQLREKARECLHKWVDRSSGHVTREDLVDALKSCQLNMTAHIINHPDVMQVKKTLQPYFPSVSVNETMEISYGKYRAILRVNGIPYVYQHHEAVKGKTDAFNAASDSIISRDKLPVSAGANGKDKLMEYADKQRLGPIHFASVEQETQMFVAFVFARFLDNISDISVHGCWCEDDNKALGNAAKLLMGVFKDGKYISILETQSGALKGAVSSEGGVNANAQAPKPQQNTPALSGDRNTPSPPSKPQQDCHGQ